MKGEMTVKATEHGYGIDMDFDDVSIADKFELMHSVSVALQMDKFDMILYCHLELGGVLSDATKTTQCEDDEQLERMLQGKPMSGEFSDAEVKALHKMLKVLEGAIHES